MQDPEALLQEAFALIRRGDVQIRHESLGGGGGGLCRLGATVFFFDDLDADPMSRLERCVEMPSAAVRRGEKDSWPGGGQAPNER